MKNPIEMVSESFIWGVGITRPKQGQERRAALFISMTLVGTVVAVAGAFLFIATHIH